VRVGRFTVLVAAMTTVLAGVIAAPPAGAAPTFIAASPLTLWYDEPASDWESRSLPTGNGALGASVFGSVNTERLSFNEKTLWTGGPGAQGGYTYGNWEQPRPNAITSVQNTINSQRQADPGQVAGILGQARRGYGAYQAFGDLTFALTQPPASVQNYRRSLDIGRAVASVSYTANGVNYSREFFASYPAGVVVARLSASQPGRISFTTGVTTPTNRSRTTSVANGRIMLAGNLSDNGMRYESQVRVLNTGGTRTDGASSVTVSGADSVVVLLAAGTNYADSYPGYRGADPHARVTSTVDSAAATPYGTLLSAHQQDYQALFNRVQLNIGQVMPDQPTDDLRAAYTGGFAPADRALEALFFAYGRYLLISSSRAGSLPANLQGVWNNSTGPPWGADYHVNINLQMNYWPAEQTNLTETTAPLFDYIGAMVPPGRRTAMEMFGNRGWVVHNETTPFGFTGVHDWPTAFWFPEAGAWLAQHLYEHYRFTLDEAFLRTRAYPMMKELAQFWLDELVVDPRDGKLVVSPSFSPEHGPFSAGAAISEQIVWDLFTNVAEAAGPIGDTGFRGEVQNALGRLDPGTRTGSWGQLREWKEDWDSQTDDHRHVSHLFGLHPGHQISPDTTPSLAQAARVSLTARGDGGTGWSKAWKINFWARLLDGDHAHRMLVEQLRTSTLPNLWDTHPPFQIDGNFGATSGVSEMLLQSQTGEIRLLPALPSDWRTGSVLGLRARGAFTIDETWADGRLTQAELVSDRGGVARLRNARFASGTVTVTDLAGGTVSVTRSGEQLSFATTVGHRYRITVAGGAGPITGIGGKCVDVNGAGTADGTKIQLWTCNGSAAQRWMPVGSTWHALGKCLDVSGGGTANGTVVQLWTCNGTGAQNWSAQADGTLRNPQSGKCLDATGGSTADGTQLIIWSCSGTPNQKWALP